MKKFSLITITVLFFTAITGFLFLRNKPDPTINQSSASPKLRYIALGDSYTIGEGVKESDRWPNQLVAALAKNGTMLELVDNPSRTGYTTQDLLQKEIPVLKNSDADFITIQIGVNDYYRGASADEFRTNFIAVLRTVKQTAPSAKILVITIPDYGKTPFGQNTGRPDVISVGIQQFNDIIKDESAKQSLPVVDIFAISQTSSLAGNIESDDLHPSGIQYKDWLSLIYPEAQKLLGG